MKKDADKIKTSSENENKPRPRTILLLIALSAIVCAAFCLMLWSAEKSNPMPAAPYVQSGVMN